MWVTSKAHPLASPLQETEPKFPIPPAAAVLPDRKTIFLSTTTSVISPRLETHTAVHVGRKSQLQGQDKITIIIHNHKQA